MLKEEIKNNNLDAIDQLITDIYDQRKQGIAEDGEYSLGNLLFKEFRNRGYLDNLKELKNKVIGQELSLKSSKKEESLESTVDADLADNRQPIKDETELTEDKSENLKPIPENFDIKALDIFNKSFIKYKLTKEDLTELKSELKRRPSKANYFGFIYKFEWWPKRFNLGKKEGKIIYIILDQHKTAWLYKIYEKNEKSDLTQEEIKLAKKLYNILKEN